MPGKLLSGLIVIVLIVGEIRGQENANPNWPQFRGPNGRAIAGDAKKLPSRFGPEVNMLWKTALPSGISSPCIWGNHIFLTGHDEKERKLETICLDRSTGVIRWRQPVPTKKIERVYTVNSPATATPTTDGKYVYSLFGSYGMLCYDFDGKEIWRRPLPTPRTGFGSATSPIVAGDLVLLNGQGNDLHLLALHRSTGEIAWKTDSPPFPSDYPVPMIWKNGDETEVIVPGRGGILAYDLKDGTKRWWMPGLSPEVCCSPTSGEGMLFVASHLPGGDPDLRMKLPAFDELLKGNDKDNNRQISRKEAPTNLLIFDRGGEEGIGQIYFHQMFWLFDKNRDSSIDEREWQTMLTNPFTNSLLAIRPGGRNDISESHVLWQYKRGVCEVPSPLYYQGRIYMVRNGGVLTCVDAKTGREAFPRARLRAGGIYYASPVAGDGKIYLASDSGLITVLKAGDQFEVLAENDLNEVIRATPALVDGRIYVRTAGHLYAFGE